MLAIRQPEWATGLEARGKGIGQLMPHEDDYRGIERVWSAGDVVEIQYAMDLRAKPDGNGRTSYWFGPWLLGASAADNPGYFNELTTENRLLSKAVGDQKLIQGRGGEFQVPMAQAAFAYAQAEYPDQPGTVQLRAIAEQTGLATTSWELRFRT